MQEKLGVKKTKINYWQHSFAINLTFLITLPKFVRIYVQEFIKSIAKQ